MTTGANDEVEELKNRFSTFSTYGSTPAQALQLFDRARHRCPIPYSNELGGFHIFLRYEDVRQGLINWRTFSNGPAALRPLAEGLRRLPPIDFDPPEHTVWRQIFNAGINAGTADRIAPLVRADTIRFIEAMAARGSCDLVEDLAERIPMLALFHVLGLGEECHRKVRHWTLALLASAGNRPEFSRIFSEFAQFGCEEVAKRRLNPRDDYLTRLAEARIDNRILTEEEIGSATVSVLLAGHGTTVTSMTNLFFEVLSRPQLKEQLIGDPSLIPRAIEETLRLHTPFFGLYRQATRDVSINGQDIKKGESVYMCWQAANRDPKVFDDPNSFRLDRDNGRHLTFGIGKHSCTGAPTARMELRTALEELLARLPDIEIVDPHSMSFEFRGAETAAITRLPARFTPRGPLT
jgi:cytochrome P450